MSSLDKQTEYSLSEQNSHESLSNSILPLLIYSVKGALASLLLFSEVLLTPAVTVNISFFFSQERCSVLSHVLLILSCCPYCVLSDLVCIPVEVCLFKYRIWKEVAALQLSALHSMYLPALSLLAMAFNPILSNLDPAFSSSR